MGYATGYGWTNAEMFVLWLKHSRTQQKHPWTASENTRPSSDTRSIKCGAPQDSILGPLLFIIYMNDICNVLELLYTIMYVDGTSVIMSGNDLESLIQSVNLEFCLLNTWLKANKLSLNVN